MDRGYNSSDSERDSSDSRPSKRARHSSPQPTPISASRSRTDNHRMSNGHAPGHGDGDAHASANSDAGSDALPLLSPSIIGVEPLDEFIREIADFIHYHIGQRPQEPGGMIEVEAKIGVLRDRAGGQRLQLPILVESSACYWLSSPEYATLTIGFFQLPCVQLPPVLAPNLTDLRFESNMSAVCP